MKIEIETKFNIDDSVWWLNTDPGEGEKPRIENLTVNQIRIIHDIGSRHRDTGEMIEGWDEPLREIWYDIGSFWTRVEEKDLYASKEELMAAW